LLIVKTLKVDIHLSQVAVFVLHVIQFETEQREQELVVGLNPYVGKQDMQLVPLHVKHPVGHCTHVLGSLR